MLYIHSKGMYTIMIVITLNGEKQKFKEGTSIQKMLDDIQVKPSISIVEYNGEICDRNMYDEVTLHNNDTVEVIRMVCGG